MGISKFLKKTIFKKEWELYNEQARNFVYATKKVENELAAEKKKNEVLFSVFKEFGDACIIGVATNKINERVLVAKVEGGRSIDLYLYNECGDNTRKSRLYSRRTTNRLGEEIIYIDDCIAEDEDVGNGTILLSSFIKEAKKTSAKYIAGELAAIDKKKFDKLKHFYEKNGFEVEITGDIGRIHYYL